jgi:hypothetical protein
MDNEDGMITTPVNSNYPLIAIGVAIQFCLADSELHLKRTFGKRQTVKLFISNLNNKYGLKFSL